MIEWKKLYNKFGQSLSSKKFEDLSLDYVRQAYPEYKWKPTKRTRDGNRDFQNIEDALYSIWGEAKYKMESGALSRKDLDPTILSGLIDGNVKLIIFVTNANIPDVLIEREFLGARIRGIKLSFILAHQLSDWLILHPEKYKLYFEEELDLKEQLSEQFIVEIKKVSFFELLSLDFSSNYKKISMNIGDVYLLSVTLFSTKDAVGNVLLEDGAPITIIEHPNYDSNKRIKIKSGINIFTFMVKTIFEYNSPVQINLNINENQYFYMTKNILIKSTPQIPVIYFCQLEVMSKIKMLIDSFDFHMGSYLFFLHGNSGMGKSYVLNCIAKDYSVKNDMTLVTFEKSIENNNNYLLLCRIIIFIEFGNIFWGYNATTEDADAFIRSIRIKCNSQNDILYNTLSEIMHGCFDANIAKEVIIYLDKQYKNGKRPLFRPQKSSGFRILLLDDIQYLHGSQSEVMKIILNFQTHHPNNSIIIISGTKKKFYDYNFENYLLSHIINYYELNELSRQDIRATLQKNFALYDMDITDNLVNKFPGNLLIFCELLFNLKYSGKNIMTNIDLLNHYIDLYDSNFIFLNKLIQYKKCFYILDIVFQFRKGIKKKYIFKYFSDDLNMLQNRLQILEGGNLITIKNNEKILPYHDYIIESYKALRKGKQFNTNTGNFFQYLIECKNIEYDTNFLLSILCKCGKRYFSTYSQKLKNLMIHYISSSQYGTAVYFAELFYNAIVQKGLDSLTKEERYYLYLYADCLVHCDKKYRAKELLMEIVSISDDFSFERYEAQISLLNQSFWEAKLDGLTELASQMQLDLELLFYDNISKDDIGRFIKAYEACFNRRMVTFLLQDQYEKALKAYQEGLSGLKRMANLYQLDYKCQIATIIMDFARGFIANSPELSYHLLKKSLEFYNRNPDNYVRRILICKIDIMVLENILLYNTNDRNFKVVIEELYNNHFNLEYIKAVMKLCACRLVRYSTIAGSGQSQPIVNETIDLLEKNIIRVDLVLKNKEKFLYNYLFAYIYIIKKKFSMAEACLLDNDQFIKMAGYSYHKPLSHNLQNMQTINRICWYKSDTEYDINTFILESRFW